MSAVMEHYIKSLKNSSLFSNAFYLILNSAVTSLLGFIFWNIMTRFFSPAQVGIGSSLITASILLGTLSNLGLGVGLIKFVPDEGERAGRLINAAFTATTGAALIASCIYLAGIEFWSPLLSVVLDQWWSTGSFILFSIGTALSMITDQSLIAGRSARFVFWKNLIICGLKIPLPILVMMHLGGYGIFAATGCAIFIGLLISWLVFLPRSFEGYVHSPVIDSRLISKMFSFSASNYVAGLFNNGPGMVYPLMILNYCGAEQSAYFYIAWMMAMVLSIIPTGIAQSLLSECTFAPSQMRTLARKSLVMALVLSSGGTVGLIMTSRWFLNIFGSGYSENAFLPVCWLAVAVIPQCINTLYTTVNQVKNKIKLIIGQAGALAALAFGLGVWMLPKYGLAGVALAYFLAHLTVAACVIPKLITDLREKPEQVSSKMQILSKLV